VIECELRLLRCRDCGVRMEPVPWARPGAQHTRDFEDVVARLAQQMAKTPICGLLQIGWDTVGRIVARVTADQLDERRLDGLVCIGVDEISYRRGQRHLTSVADHRSGAIVWCRPGRNSATLAEFFAELGLRKDSIRAVSVDMSGEYQRATRDAIPDAEICFDPFHVCRLASRATDQVRRDEWNAHERSHTPSGKWVKGTRWSLLKSARPSTSSPRSTRSSRPTARSTAPSCCAKSCGCSTTSTTRRSRRHIWTPGSHGRPAPV
jgi:transposase